MEISLKHMESSLDPLAIVSTELKARNKSVTLKKLSINDNNEHPPRRISINNRRILIM
jgi:hypothetical protein